MFFSLVPPSKKLKYGKPTVKKNTLYILPNGNPEKNYCSQFILSGNQSRCPFAHIKVCKKCPKVNPYCEDILDSIMFKPVLDGAKLPTFCAKYLSLSNSQILGVFFGFVCEKSRRAGQRTMKFTPCKCEQNT